MRVPESIPELRTICQAGPHAAGQPWLFRQIRRVSIYLTWLLLHLPLSPNQITVMAIAGGIVASAVIASGELLSGAIVLVLTLMLDFSDGEVSRYRKIHSRAGAFLDKMYHFTLTPVMFAGVAIASDRPEHSTLLVVAGFICAIWSFLLAMTSAYAPQLAVWHHGKRLLGRLENASDDEFREIVTNLQPMGTSGEKRPVTPEFGRAVKASRIARFLFNSASLWDFPYVILVVVCVVVTQRFLPAVRIGGIDTSPLGIALVFYMVTYPIWMVFFLWYVLAAQVTQRGYDEFSRQIDRIFRRAHASNTNA